jgi:NADH-quinone oxidoreductase subunit F
MLEDLEAGKGTEADLDKLLDLCDNIAGRSFCALADGAVAPIISTLKYFRSEYIAHQTNGECPFDPVASTLFDAVGAK